MGTLEKQIEMMEKATGKKLSPDARAATGGSIARDGEPYTAEEHRRADPQQGALNWNSGNHVHSPLNAPKPNLQPKLTPTPRVDAGRSGVDEIVRGSK